MKKFISAGLGVFLLFFFCSCYSYREVAGNEDVINKKVRYRVTLSPTGKKQKRIKADSVYWEQDSVWVNTNNKVFGFPAATVKVEERRVNWWKTVPLFAVGSAAVITGAVILLDGSFGIMDYNWLTPAK